MCLISKEPQFKQLLYRIVKLLLTRSILEDSSLFTIAFRPFSCFSSHFYYCRGIRCRILVINSATQTEMRLFKKKILLKFFEMRQLPESKLYDVESKSVRNCFQERRKLQRMEVPVYFSARPLQKAV